MCFPFFFFLSSGGCGKIKLKLTTFPRLNVQVVCQFTSIVFAIQRVILVLFSLVAVKTEYRHLGPPLPPPPFPPPIRICIEKMKKYSSDVRSTKKDIQVCVCFRFFFFVAVKDLMAASTVLCALAVQ